MTDYQVTFRPAPDKPAVFHTTVQAESAAQAVKQARRRFLRDEFVLATALMKLHVQVKEIRK